MRSLYRVGAKQEIMGGLAKYKIHIAGMQEIRWKGNDVMDLRVFTLFNSVNRNNTVHRDFLIKE